MGTLDGQIAVVTGASRGIGRGVAIGLGEQGATVYVTGRSIGDKPRTIDTTAREVTEAGGKGIAIQTDHFDDAQIEAVFTQIKDNHGHLDILVNNVFKIPDPPAWEGGFWEHPVSIWDDQVGIGLRGHYVASWHAAPLLFESPNRPIIINITSPAGLVYLFNSSYSVGKAGLDRLTHDMAVELAPFGIRVNAVNPVAGETPLLASFMGEDTPEMRARFLSTIPLGRFSPPADIAAAALFLCSDDASMITGVAMEVDGGRCI